MEEFQDFWQLMLSGQKQDLKVGFFSEIKCFKYQQTERQSSPEIILGSFKAPDIL